MLYILQCGDYEGCTVLGATTNRQAAIREARKRAEVELVHSQRWDPSYERLYERHDVSKSHVFSVSLADDPCGYSWDVLAFDDGEFYPHNPA
jgi:hypothetical protein